MTQDQAEFFKSKLFPIIRECAEDREEPCHEKNPIRPILAQLLRYTNYLEERVKKLEVS